jgi:hypothetical protein
MIRSRDNALIVGTQSYLIRAITMTRTMAGAWNDQLIQHHPANQIKLKFRACPFHTATTIIGAEESHTIRTFLLHVIVSSRVGWGKVRQCFVLSHCLVCGNTMLWCKFQFWFWLDRCVWLWRWLLERQATR